MILAVVLCAVAGVAVAAAAAVEPGELMESASSVPGLPLSQTSVSYRGRYP